MNKTLLLPLSCAVFFVGFTSCSNDIEKGTSTVKPIKFTANALMQKFEKNAAKYDTVYAQKAIQIKGEIIEVDASSLGHTVFVLKTNNKDGAAIKCEMLNDDMQYEPGDKVCVKGFFKEYEFHVFLDKCLTCSST